MGYRSDVRIATTREGYDMMCDAVDDMGGERKCHPLLGSKQVPDFFTEHDGCVAFGWDSIKWYEGFYADVDNVMRALGKLSGSGVPYEFCRAGESYDDIEFESHNGNEVLSMHVYPNVAIEVSIN